MATQVLTDVSVTFGANNFSPYTKGVQVKLTAETLDDTNMGDTFKGRRPGLKDWGGSIQVSADYADNASDEMAFNLVGTEVTFTGKPTSSAVGASNPSYSGSAIITGYEPFNGSVGQAGSFTLTFEGNGALTRATS
jgi:hypothetical protein